MKNILKKSLIFIGLFLGLHTVFAQGDHPVIDAIQKEVDRNKTLLKMENIDPPFFISYSVMDRYDYNLKASLGSISSYTESHSRFGIPLLLVGDYHRNNLKTPRASAFASSTSLFDNENGIPFSIWRDLDGLYKTSVESFKAKMAVLQQQTQTEEEKNLPDFEQVKPVNMVLKPVPVNFNRPYWENYLRKASEIAKQYPDILSSNAGLMVRNIMTYTYNTEGSRYAFPSTLYGLNFSVNTRAADGQDLTYAIYIEHATFEQMPDLATFTYQCKEAIDILIQLKNAPVVNDAYSGPVLFESSALYNLILQVFINSNKLIAMPKQVQMPGGMSMMMVDGVPQFMSGQQNANDFELMLNKKVISRDLTFKSITGQEFYKGQRLNGYYPIDHEGVVPDKEFVLIENGVLRNLLNGRIPTAKIKNSNGHARFDYNSNRNRVTVGNILITSKQTFSENELRKKLIDAAKEEDLEYVYVVKAFGGGPHLFYKVYAADGREELVRGASISEAVSLRPFKRILGASDKEQINSSYHSQITLVMPTAMLFEEMDITRTPNIEFKKPYLVPKP